VWLRANRRAFCSPTRQHSEGPPGVARATSPPLGDVDGPRPARFCPGRGGIEGERRPLASTSASRLEGRADAQDSTLRPPFPRLAQGPWKYSRNGPEVVGVGDEYQNLQPIRLSSVTLPSVRTWREFASHVAGAAATDAKMKIWPVDPTNQMVRRDRKRNAARNEPCRPQTAGEPLRGGDATRSQGDLGQGLSRGRRMRGLVGAAMGAGQ